MRSHSHPPEVAAPFSGAPHIVSAAGLSAGSAKWATYPPPQRLRGGRFLRFALFGTRSFTRSHLEVLPNSLVHTARRVAGEVEVGRTREEQG